MWELDVCVLQTLAVCNWSVYDSNVVNLNLFINL